MHKHPLRWSLLVLVCLMAVACHDRREPVKPTVVQPVHAGAAQA